MIRQIAAATKTDKVQFLANHEFQGKEYSKLCLTEELAKKINDHCSTIHEYDSGVYDTQYLLSIGYL